MGAASNPVRTYMNATVLFNLFTAAELRTREYNLKFTLCSLPNVR